MSVTDIAWAAGLFEGEGSMQVMPPKGKPRMDVASTDPDVLARFARIVGCGNISKPIHRRGCKPIQHWRLYKSSQIVRVLLLFYGHLGERRRVKADEVLDASLRTVVRIAARAARREGDVYIVPAEVFIQLLAAVGKGD